MEAPATMGEAGEVNKEDSNGLDSPRDTTVVNGNLSSPEPMEVDKSTDDVNKDLEDDPEEEIQEELKVESLSIDKVPDPVPEADDKTVEEEEEEEEEVKNDDEEVVAVMVKDDDESQDEGSVNQVVVNGDDIEDKEDDVVLVSEERENGECSSDVECVSDDRVEVINLVSSPKRKHSKKTCGSPLLTEVPRRSSRNLNKRQKSYVEDEEEEQNKVDSGGSDEESDIEEVTPEDPLADPLRDDKENKDKKRGRPRATASTIVVSDTKRLVEIAANSKSSSGNKKEPTLVIIDTNSILSGRGPVPVQQKSTMPASFSMMPVALPAQGVYPPNMRATITPIPMNINMNGPSSVQLQMPVQVPAAASVTPTAVPPPPKQAPPPPPQQPATPPAPILPTLTDDMYVVEAPSFIVPYVYEKPPVRPLKEFVKELGKEIEKEKDKIKEESNKDEDEDADDDDEKKKKEDGEESKEKQKEMNGGQLLSSTSISSSYFDNALGQFFSNIGFNLVQEFVQTDLLKQQKRKQQREGSTPETAQAIHSLLKNLEYSKENNEPFRLEQRKCEFCSFRTESELVLAHHLETPHMRNYVYRCNFCPLEVRSPHDILFHMEALHGVRGRLERAPAFHQCPNCPFEDNQKGKLSRHQVTCAKKFKPELNLCPPPDWEPPAKIPRVPRLKHHHTQPVSPAAAAAATYQALAHSKSSYHVFAKLHQQTSPGGFPRGRGRPSLMGKVPSMGQSSRGTQQPLLRTPAGVMYRSPPASVLVPASYQMFQNSNSSASATLVPPSSVSVVSKSKTIQQPSISITPLPRSAGASSGLSKDPSSPSSPSSKQTFVICEICDGYIKDLEQLRNHMQWIHKVKIHPKMIYNRPPLNCQKCQFRFFTDQGLERHLLGSHGLVTSSMQEAANKSKDAGRCPVCGRVYQWKLLNHVARDHNMTLKPAHLSYKCTVCTATFGMYKQFENHVYSAHSVVAKRVMDKKASSAASSSSSSAASTSTASSSSSPKTGDSLLKPLKINDEITIIPQPAKSKAATVTRVSATK